MGVNPLVQQMAALLISVAVVGVGASLRVFERGSILPSDFFFDLTLLTLAMLIVGGRNSVTGAIVGVTVMTAGSEIARKMGQPESRRRGRHRSRVDHRASHRSGTTNRPGRHR